MESNPEHCGREVVENHYYKALAAGAAWYCFECRSHLTKEMKKLFWDKERELFETKKNKKNDSSRT